MGKVGKTLNFMVFFCFGLESAGLVARLSGS